MASRRALTAIESAFLDAIPDEVLSWEDEQDTFQRELPRRRVAWANDPAGDYWRQPCGCQETKDRHGRPICGRVVSETGGCEVCQGTKLLVGRPYQPYASRRPVAPNIEAKGGELDRAAFRVRTEAGWIAKETLCRNCSGCECDGGAQGDVEQRDDEIRRRAADESTADLAASYGLSERTINRIKNGNPQRPMGRYGHGDHVKKPTARELAAMHRYAAQLADGTWKARQDLGETDPELEYSKWPRHPETGRPIFWGGHTCPL